MQYNKKEDEVSFHLDRTKEAATTLLRSIVDNPMLSAEEQCTLLVKLARHHQEIVSVIGGSVIAGQAMSLAGLASLDEQ